MNQHLKRFVHRYSGIVGFGLRLYNFANCKNRLRTRGTKLSYSIAFLQGLKIDSCGTDNKIIFDDFVRMKNCTITIYGSHNTIHIGGRVVLDGVQLWIEDNGNEIQIGEGTEVYGPSQLAAIEGAKIKIGKNCLFSRELHIRTGDSHSVLDMDGKRVNPSEDVEIDDHVWIGMRVTCLKGVCVAADSVVAATTTLCKKYDEKNAVICGVPGRVVRTGVNWCHDRVAIEE
jgi:acetyltransferase-like isoleucine patch superfamily enzyme